MSIKKLDYVKILSSEEFEKFDFTGKTGLSDFDKKAAFDLFIENHKNHIIFTEKLQSVKKLGSLEDTEDIDADIENLREPIKNALVYIGYTDGNFVWTDFLLICEATANNTKGYLYLCIQKEKGIGRIFSALHDEISRFGKISKHESNIHKMMKRNKYELIDPNQKEFLFGKGHMSAGNLKTIVKKDLDVIFDFMKESKTKANSGDVSPCEFDLTKLRFFKFKKI